MHSVSKLALILALGGASACTEGSTLETTVLGTTAIYSPTTGDIPLPSDLLFLGSLDGTLNPPLPTNPGQAAVAAALSSLDGWSPVARWTLAFSAPIDASTIVPGQTLRAFRVSTATTQVPIGGPVSAVLAELDGTLADPLSGLPLDPAADFLVRLPVDGRSIEMLPLRPLAPESSYTVHLFGAVLDAEGAPVTRSVVYAAAAQSQPLSPFDPLAPVQALVLAMHAAAASQGIPPDSILVSTQFTTQSIADVLSASASAQAGGEAALIAALGANPNVVVNSTTPNPAWSPSLGAVWQQIGDTGSLIGSPANAADAWQGSLTLPYLLGSAAPGGPAPTDLSSDASVLSTRWRSRYAADPDDLDLHPTRFNPLPLVRSAAEVPVLLSVPKTPKPPGGWPVVVFQHGITRARADLLAVADVLAFSGFAVVGIDLPLHGLESGDPLFVGYGATGARERTFGLDLADNSSGASGPDGLPEPSGFHFLNLANLAVARDNLRQGALDQLALLRTLGTLDYDGGGPDLDAADLHFVGHSLGAITGAVSLALGGDFESATLAMPGGGIAGLLAGSGVYGPVLEAALADFGINPGSAAFEAFLASAQTVVDSGDPLNHAAALAAGPLPIHLIEIVGQSGVSPSDQTIPNSVAGRPLSGTEPLIAALGLAPITASTIDPAGIRGAVRFSAGDHASILLPTASAAATAEIQSQLVEFALTNGQSLSITDPGVIAP
jgi:hypothetical protein